MIDVICPIKYGTPPTWRSNLVNWFTELPIGRLLIGDGGVEDNTFRVLREFSRVTVLDHRHLHSQGRSIRDLIESAETDWFVYLHADVQLAEGWYTEMVKSQKDLDWFECERWIVELANGRCYRSPHQNEAARPYSGSQMGRKAAFTPFLERIDDDYLFRNEDLVLGALVQEAGGHYGRVLTTRHYHQVGPHRTGDRQPAVFDNFVRGIIKYCKPRDYLITAVHAGIAQLPKGHDLDALRQWTTATNDAWTREVEEASRARRNLPG